MPVMKGRETERPGVPEKYATMNEMPHPCDYGPAATWAEKSLVEENRVTHFEISEVENSEMAGFRRSWKAQNG
ncbi:MAG: hypothetical protein ACE5JS_19925 [Nitrospinota bacterium]